MPSRITRRAALGALGGAVAALRIPAAKAADTLRVGKSVIENIGYIPLDVGIETGIFERNGVTVQAINFETAARLHQAMIAGSADIGLSAGPEMAFIAKGAPEIAVAAISESSAFMAVVAAGQSNVRDMDDLKGKRIGITSAGSLTDWLVGELNRFKGWTKDGDRATTVAIGGATPAQVAALKTGAVDATVASLQGGYLFEERQVGRLLFDGSAYVPAMELNTVFATTNVVQSNPDALRRFLKGWFEAVQYMKGHKDETVRIGAKAMNDPPDVVSRAYDALMTKFSTDGRFHPQGLETLAKSFTDLKTFDHPVDMSTLYTEKFLPGSAA
jgi:ABC-type nitrate/sulfonate/bicarbonate transport system substrate-binding protein